MTRMVGIGMAILMLSACDKVVINYGEGSDVNKRGGTDTQAFALYKLTQPSV